MYNEPIISVNNTNNLVYRYKPYILEFEILPPTVNESESVEFDSKNQIEGGVIYEYPVDKLEWKVDENNSVEIFNLEVNNKVLIITGKKLVSYKYEIYFNDKIIQNESDIIVGKTVSTINILDSYFNDFVDGTVTIKVLYGDSKSTLYKYDLQLINTAPNIIIGDIINNKLNLTITDDESDPIKLSIKLNGKDYHPAEGGFTDFVNTPYFYSTQFSSSELNINPNDFITPNNIVTVSVIDKYGAETQLHKRFVGEFVGIMFVDENNEFYSDDTNNYENDKNILKEQNLGNLKAGTIGKKKLTYLLNKTNFKLTNIQLSLNTLTIPDQTYVKLSKDITTDFNSMTDKLDFENLILDINERLPFYIQANTKILSLGGSYYYVDAIADPIE